MVVQESLTGDLNREGEKHSDLFDFFFKLISYLSYYTEISKKQGSVFIYCYVLRFITIYITKM